MSDDSMARTAACLSAPPEVQPKTSRGETSFPVISRRLLSNGIRRAAKDRGVDAVTPHPVCGRMGWVAVNVPSVATLDGLQGLIEGAHALDA